MKDILGKRFDYPFHGILAECTNRLGLLRFRENSTNVLLSQSPDNRLFEMESPELGLVVEGTRMGRIGNYFRLNFPKELSHLREGRKKVFAECRTPPFVLTVSANGIYSAFI
jgi:hypothetical protein